MTQRLLFFSYYLQGEQSRKCESYRASKLIETGLKPWFQILLFCPSNHTASQRPSMTIQIKGNLPVNTTEV